jgi:hypothetical protein
MSKKSQEGITLLWTIFAGILFITGVEVALLVRTQKRFQDLIEAQPTPSASPEQTAQPKATPPEPTLFPTNRPYQAPSREEELLKILPPKERAELESAIRETQQVLQNIEVFNFAPPSIDEITQGLDQINKQAQEQIQKDLEKHQQEYTPPEIDYEGLEEYLKQNPQYGPDYQSPQEQKLEEIEEMLEVDLDKPH